MLWMVVPTRGTPAHESNHGEPMPWECNMGARERASAAALHTTHLPAFTTVAWERLSEGNFPRAVALLFACCLPHPMSDPFTTCKHLPFRAASGEFCVEVRVGLSQHRIAAPLCSGTKYSIQGPERPVIRPLFHKRED